MSKTGRLYSPEFRAEAIRLVHSCEERHPVAKIAGHNLRQERCLVSAKRSKA